MSSTRRSLSAGAVAKRLTTASTSSRFRPSARLARSSHLFGSTIGCTKAKLSELREGSLCETLCAVVVCDASDGTYMVPDGTTLEVLAADEDGRVQVGIGRKRPRRTEGFITTDPEVMLYSQAMLAKLDFEVGCKCMAKGKVTVRTREALGSGVVIALARADPVEVVELGMMNIRRVRIKSKATKGWVSTMSFSAEMLIGTGSSDEVRQFMSFAMAGDVDGVKRHTAKPASLFSRWVAQIEQIAYLDANSTDDRMRTALMYAAAWGQKVVVDHLLAQPRINVNMCDDTGKTALHHACENSVSILRGGCQDEGAEQAMIIGELLERGADVNAQDVQGRTALMIAAEGGDCLVVSRLLDAGADPELRNRAGRTAARLARGDARAPLTAGSAAEAAQFESTEASIKGDSMSDKTSTCSKVGELDSNPTSTTCASGAEQVDDVGMMPTPTVDNAARSKARSGKMTLRSRVAKAPTPLDLDDMQTTSTTRSGKPKSPSRVRAPAKSFERLKSIEGAESPMGSTRTGERRTSVDRMKSVEALESRMGRTKTGERRNSFERRKSVDRDAAEVANGMGMSRSRRSIDSDADAPGSQRRKTKTGERRKSFERRKSVDRDAAEVANGMARTRSKKNLDSDAEAGGSPMGRTKTGEGRKTFEGKKSVARDTAAGANAMGTTRSGKSITSVAEAGGNAMGRTRTVDELAEGGNVMGMTWSRFSIDLDDVLSEEEKSESDEAPGADATGEQSVDGDAEALQKI